MGKNSWGKVGGKLLEKLFIVWGKVENYKLFINFSTKQNKFSTAFYNVSIRHFSTFKHPLLILLI